MKHANKKSTWKKKLAAGGVFFGIFALSAGAAYALFPQATITERNNPKPIDIQPIHTTGRDLFISNLTNSATNGLSIRADELVFEIDGKAEVVGEGESQSTIEHANVIDASGTTIDLALTSLSLHGINFALTAPITYSDASLRPHERGIHASMVNETIYLNLFDSVNSFDEQNNPIVTYNGNWDFRYKVDVSSYDQGGSTQIDPVTGGVLQYEYGDLDWLLEDIFEILSEGGLDISLEGWLDKLTGTSEETTAPSSEEEASSGGISTDAIMESMGAMAEVEHEGLPYFVWKLPLGSKTIELGLRSNEDYALTGIDLPALYDVEEHQEEEETVYTKSANDETAWEIQEGMSLRAHATVSDFEDIHDGWDESLIPGDVDSYRDLKNSRQLLESVAKYVANPQIGLDVDLDLGLSTQAKQGDRTHMKADAMEDSIRLALGLDADLSERKFHGLSAGLSLQKIGEEDAVLAHQDVNVSYLYDQVEKEGDGYFDVNGSFFKGHTTKTYLDEFYASVLQDAFSSSDVQEEGQEQNTLNQIQEVMNRLDLSIDAIVNSDLLKDIQNGVYVSAVDLIDYIRNEDNRILVGLTLAPIGLEGHVVLTLNGTAEHSDLLDIEIQNIRFASFSLNGVIKTRPFAALPTKESFDSSYQDLCHLKGIGEQIVDIVHEEAFKADLAVSLSHQEEEETIHDLALQGDMRFAFASDYKAGKLSLLAEQSLSDKIAPSHRVALDLSNDFKDVAFAYASGASQDELTSLPNDAVKAKLGLQTLKESLDPILGRVDAIDDRYSRLVSSFVQEGGTSLLSRLTKGEISALLEDHDLIRSATLHDADGNTTIVLNKEAIGLEDDLVVTLRYQESAQEQEGGIEALSVQVPLKEKELSISLSGIEALAIKDEGEEPATKEAEKAQFHNFASTEGFHDLSFLGEVGEYLLGSLTLGTVADQDEEGHKVVTGVSHYGLEGRLGVNLGTHQLQVGLFDAYASVEGAETKAYMNLSGIPVIRGVNGPDSNVYFRPNEAEGVRSSSLYYYANGVDPKGQALLTRDSSYGRVRNVRDAVRLEGEQFTSNLFGWLGRYSLGILDSLLDEPEEATPVTPAPFAPNHKGRAGLLGDEPLRLETVIGSFTKAHDEVSGEDSYSLSADIGKLLGVDLLGEARITLKGNSFVAHGHSFKALTGLNVHADASAKAVNTGNALHLASVDVDLFLNNIVNGEMKDVWTDEFAGSAYEDLFVKSVSDDGLIDEEETGLLFSFPDCAFSNAEGAETQMYGYNFVGKEEARPGNYFLGL